jgi:pimeloyl-ACP methyl ester carboxylesterase
VQNPSELQTALDGKAEPGKVACYLQQEPARKLKNLQNIPVLFLNGEGGYHRVYDHCLAKWLNQAGVKTEYVEMEKVGLPGNGHMMMLEKNSADIAKYMGSWLSKNANGSKGESSKAMPPKTIPTFSTETIAQKGFLFAGGAYWGEAGREIMRGAMYTEVWVPRQIRQPNPVVLYHGNGQTGVDWQQTPDGRPGWAYHLVQQGYVVYMVDYPARGRSAYVPLAGPDGKTPIDGNLGIRTALELERIWTNARERGDFPLKMNHTQWPGSGKIGDPIFDNFMRTQVQFAGASPALARDAGIALLEMIGTPVILFTHSQGGGIGFDVTEARPNLVKAMVTV